MQSDKRAKSRSTTCRRTRAVRLVLEEHVEEEVEEEAAYLCHLVVLHVLLTGGQDGLQHMKSQEPSSQVPYQRNP